jgi:hypothetical protein
VHENKFVDAETLVRRDIRKKDAKIYRMSWEKMGYPKAPWDLEI